ncbi:CDP-alcohol phosphatidyltransferase family protein [Paenibacillus methanolicus]|uniref:CDP-alcohol phosphatidyltransferase family protein n=1 Tax=Paenibacillus methanolicus TaxID=582686 RepID=UPI0011E7AB36|nr:CDP-alcohol phosphatidyltransferase family protein [Paenibacillus methanolicus]
MATIDHYRKLGVFLRWHAILILIIGIIGALNQGFEQSNGNVYIDKGFFLWLIGGYLAALILYALSVMLTGLDGIAAREQNKQSD